MEEGKALQDQDQAMTTGEQQDKTNQKQDQGIGKEQEKVSRTDSLNMTSGPCKPVQAHQKPTTANTTKGQGTPVLQRKSKGTCTSTPLMTTRDPTPANQPQPELALHQEPPTVKSPVKKLQPAFTTLPKEER
jgi:hypothetical protein